MLGATLLVALLLLPRLGAPLTLLVCQALGAVLVAVAERRWPFRPAWNRSHGDVRTDLAHVLVSGSGRRRWRGRWRWRRGW